MDKDAVSPDKGTEEVKVTPENTQLGDQAKEGESKPNLDEIALKLVNEEIKLEDLPPDQRKAFHNEYVKTGKIEKVGKPAAQEIIPANPDATPADTLPKQKSEKPAPDYVPGAKYKEKADKANTLQQQLNNAQKKIADLEALKPPEVKRDKEEEEDNPALKEIRDDKERQRKTINFQQEEERARVHNLERENTMLELDNIQVVEPALRTAKPFSELDSEYAAFQSKVGGPENREKFLNDPQYRAQIEAQGIFFPMSDDDFKKYANIIDIHHTKVGSAKKGEKHDYKTYNAALYEWKMKNPDLIKVEKPTVDPVAQAALISAEQTANAMQVNNLNSSQSTSLPANGGKTGGGGWTRESAFNWLSSYPASPTPAQKVTRAEIHALVRSGTLKG